MDTLLVCTLLASATLLTTDAGTPMDPESVRMAEGVRDPVFAYLVGLVEGNIYGTVDTEVLDHAVRRAGHSTSLPYRHLDRLIRTREEGTHTARVEAFFHGKLSLPIPYRILGYPPGRLRASQEVLLREWNLGQMTLEHEDESGATVNVDLSDVHLFGVLGGSLWVDIDGWLDALAGGKLDDTRITGLVLFRNGGELWGMAVGYNGDWNGRSGLLSFREDEIRFPSPPPLKTAARKLRQVLEGLEPRLRPDSLKTRASR